MVQNGSEFLSGKVSVFSGNFRRFVAEVETFSTPITFPLIVGGLLTCETSALLVVAY